MEIFRAHPVLTLRIFAEGAAMLLFAPPPLVALAKMGAFEPGPECTRLWIDQDLFALARRLAREHPAVFAASAASMLWLVFLWSAAGAGLLAAPRAVGAGPAAVLGVVILYFVVLSAGTDALDDRFRVPLVPAACVLAGIALAPRLAAVGPGA